MLKFLIPITIMLLASSLLMAKEIGHVSLVKGQAWASSPAGQKRELKKDSTIKLSDTLETGKASLLRVKTTTKTIITIGPNSILRVIEYKFKATDAPKTEVFSLIKGKIRSSVQKRLNPKDKVQFKTKVISLGVRGTEFLLNQHTDSSDVALLTGSLLIDTSGLGAGVDNFTINPGQAFNTQDFDRRGMNAVQSLPPSALESLKDDETFLPDLSDQQAAKALGMEVGEAGKLEFHSGKGKNLEVTEQSKDHVCFGGGIFLTSDTFTIEHKYEDFQPGGECKDVGDPHEIGGIYVTRQAEVDKFLKELEDGKICPGIEDIIKDFKKSLAEVENHFEVLDAERSKLLEQGELVKDIQKDHAYHALTSSLCRSSHVVHRSEVYFYLLNNIYDGYDILGPDYRAHQDGQVLKDCSFIKASGDDRLRRFIVSLENSKSNTLKINYNTYTTPDNIKLLAGGDTIFESGCVATVSETERSINVSRHLTPQIAVVIEPDCRFAADTSAWEFNLSCPAKKTMPNKCSEKLRKLTQAIEVFIDSSKPILNKFWAQSYCYEKLDHEINERSAELSMFKRVLATNIKGSQTRHALQREKSGMEQLLKATEGKTEEAQANKLRKNVLSQIDQALSQMADGVIESGVTVMPQISGDSSEESTTDFEETEPTHSSPPSSDQSNVLTFGESDFDEGEVVEQDMSNVQGPVPEDAAKAVETKNEDGGTVLRFD